MQARPRHAWAALVGPPARASSGPHQPQRLAGAGLGDVFGVEGQGVPLLAQHSYGDTGSFRKVFTRTTGVTPGAYRQRFLLRTSRKQWAGPQAGLGDNAP